MLIGVCIPAPLIPSIAEVAIGLVAIPPPPPTSVAVSVPPPLTAISTGTTIFAIVFCCSASLKLSTTELPKIEASVLIESNAAVTLFFNPSAKSENPWTILSLSKVKTPIIISPIPLNSVIKLFANVFIIVEKVENTNFPTANIFLKLAINEFTANWIGNELLYKSIK